MNNVVILDKQTGAVVRDATASEAAEYSAARRWHPLVLSTGETADEAPGARLDNSMLPLFW